MKVGDTKSVTVPNEEAFGPYNPELVFDVPKDQMPPDAELEPGVRIKDSSGAGKKLLFTILEVGDVTVKVDANHPLSDQDLIFGVELLSID